MTLLVAPAAAAAKSLQSCPTLRDPMDCSPPGSSVHGIFQARVLEWGAIEEELQKSLMCKGVNLMKINILELEIFTPEKQTYKANNNL